ncbi:hemolysin family protein [Rhodobacteraceae bacterium DSL-40]|uniref:hemolysin family protein n=1 Tax=Amaricoccus sp. B4 TaxID=3368557 RepID=UPI000DAE15A6
MGEKADGKSEPDHSRDESEDSESPGRSHSILARLFGLNGGSDEPDETEPSSVAAAETLRARNMLVNLRNMRTLKVNDVSVPRADIVAVPVDAERDEVLGVFIEHTWTRLPVYSETLDQPLGLVHFKDFALKYGFGRSDDAFEMKGLIRPLLYVPPSMPIGVLLHKMQIARIHMALVIDEYGGVDGLVTIEDLLEQIVGDIADEHDEDESGIWIVEGPDVYVAAARMDLEDFEAETGVQISLPNRDEEPDTLGGLVFRIAGRVPERGEIVIHEDGHEFEILDADARRIKRLRVRLKRHRDDDPLAEAAE